MSNHELCADAITAMGREVARLAERAEVLEAALRDALDNLNEWVDEGREHELIGSARIIICAALAAAPKGEAT